MPQYIEELRCHNSIAPLFSNLLLGFGRALLPSFARNWVILSLSKDKITHIRAIELWVEMAVLMIQIMFLLLDINLEMLPIQQKSIMPNTKLWEKLENWSYFDQQCIAWSSCTLPHSSIRSRAKNENLLLTYWEKIFSAKRQYFLVKSN